MACEYAADAALTQRERLAVAACRLNCGEWDEILGPKPFGFDGLPDVPPKRFFFGRRHACKLDYTIPAYNAIKRIVGEAAISRCWWVYHMGRPEEDWLQWYVSMHIKAYRKASHIFGG